MTPDDPFQTTSASDATLPASTRLGAVHLNVSDLARSVAWYGRVAGLQPAEQSDGTAALRAGGDDLVVLHEVPGARPGDHHAGLFHIALLHDSREELGHALGRIAASGEPLTGASDHGVSEALYVRDPDHNGVEIYADRAREAWPPPAPGARVGMFTAPLDLDDLLATIAGEEPRAKAGAGLTVGHVHLQVSDVASALDFYRDALGLELMVGMPGAAFLAAAGYHHHLGLNSWQTAGAAPAPPGSAGLQRWTIELGDAGEVAAVAERLRAHGHEPVQENGGIVVVDPWRIELLVSA